MRINSLFVWVYWIFLHYLVDSFQRVVLRGNKTIVVCKDPRSCIRRKGWLSWFVKWKQQEWFFLNSSFEAIFLRWFERSWGWYNFLMNLWVTCWHRDYLLCDLDVIKIAVVELLSIWLEHWILVFFCLAGHWLGQNL